METELFGMQYTLIYTYGFLTTDPFLHFKIVVGYPFYKSCFKSLAHRSMGMDMLIAVATTVAYLYSIAALITNITTGSGYELFFDSGPLLLLFITLGKLLEHIAKVYVVMMLQLG